MKTRLMANARATFEPLKGMNHHMNRAFSNGNPNARVLARGKQPGREILLGPALTVITWLAIGVLPSAVMATTATLILIPGTSSRYLSSRLPTGDMAVHPALNDWEPHRAGDAGQYQSAFQLPGSRNTGDAIVNMIKSKLPPGTDLQITVFAKGASGDKGSSWVGENSDQARQWAAGELAGRIDAVPKDGTLILADWSHGDTVATLAANQSARGVDLKVSFASPGIVAPDPGKIGYAVNFYHPNDGVARNAGSSDLLSQGPSPSPNRVTNPGGAVANIPVAQLPILDSAGNVINPPTIAGIAEHSYLVDPRVIDQEVGSKFGRALEEFAASSAPSDIGTGAGTPVLGLGDAIASAGEAYSTSPESPNARTGGGSSDPFLFGDPNSDFVARAPDIAPAPLLAPEPPQQNASHAQPPGPTPPKPAPPNGSSGGLSDVRVSSRNISVTLTDHGLVVDGDIVNFIVNGKTVLKSFTLKGPPGDTFRVTLLPGNNVIEVYAVNEGDVPPNTAQLRISDVVTGQPIQEYSVGLHESATLRVNAPGGK